MFHGTICFYSFGEFVLLFYRNVQPAMHVKGGPLYRSIQ